VSSVTPAESCYFGLRLDYTHRMRSEEPRQLSQLFDAFCAGDRSASDELLHVVYDDLRRLAGAVFQNAGAGHTLQATALVNEAWLRLVGKDEEAVAWDTRAHFFGAAAQAMRRILVDRSRRKAWLRLAAGSPSIENRHHFFALAARAMRYVLADHAKARAREKRGGDRMRVTLTGDALAISGEGLELLAFHDALEKLGQLNERVYRVAELRLLGTLSLPEISDVIGVSERTVKRDWQFARLWLTKELGGT